MYQSVTIGNPAFAVAALVACFTIVPFLTPHSVSVLEPERRSPSANCGVEENVGFDVLAHHAFSADNALCVFFSHRASVRSHGRELCADAVKLEESEIIATLVAQIGDGARECFVILRIGKLHTSFALPEVATIVATLSVATHRAQPRTNARTHFAR